jgi:hypothetical protein
MKDLLIMAGFVLAWWLLQTQILPRLGVAT